MTEEAVRTRKLNSLEKSILTELKNSISKASRFASLWAAIGGLSPAFAPILCLISFFLSFQGLLSLGSAIQISVVVALLIMFF